MKTLINSALVCLITMLGLQAGTQSFTSNQSIGEFGSTFTFTQFNSSLGSLTAIDLIINSSVPQGNFTITRNNSGGSTVGSLTNFSEKLILSDDNTDVFTGSITNLSFSGNTTIPRNMGTRTFNLNNSQSLLSTIPSTVSVASTSWSLYTGLGTVDLAASITPEATFTGGLGITASYAGLGTPTSLTLRYSYSTSSVPEPSQVAASLLLLGGIGGYIFIKRKRQLTGA